MKLEISTRTLKINYEYLVATASNASAGQDWNQSIVQQLTMEGNFLTRLRKLSPKIQKVLIFFIFFMSEKLPIGDMQRIT